MSTLYYLLSELLSKIGRENNETMENLKLRAIISFLHEKGEQDVRGMANQVYPYFDPLSCRFFSSLNPRIAAGGSFYKENCTAYGIKCLGVISNS